MDIQKKIFMSGQVGIAEVQNIVSQLENTAVSGVDLELDNVGDIDITGVQLIVALKERFGTELNLRIGALDPNLQSLLESSGIYDLLNDFSNS